MYTFNQLWNIKTPKEAKKIINSQCIDIDEPINLEQQALKTVGRDIYYKLIKGYTEKQWRKSADQLPKEIIKRIPIRYTYDNNYFNDKYQGIPVDGYTHIFKKLLNNIEVKLNIDYLSNKEYWNSKAKKIIYTGPIDSYYNYEFGDLEYKTTKFEHELLNTENYQGNAVVNYTDISVPYTRIIEHKHFEKKQCSRSWITREYPTEFNFKTSEPYYPVNDNLNNEKFLKYKMKSSSEKNIIFGGRLAEYKYYDMHNVIESALNTINNLSNTK
jgi:UDP-galactopyranose mutase